jgi:DNA invertase Pin-like site-specific DNA recombinase
MTATLPEQRGRNGKQQREREPSNGRASAARTLRRCAIYTRKSTTEGLDSGFSSLDAQREAGELYVRSQTANGWTALPTRYDDGGFTGGNLERPALARLMEDIERGVVDTVVVAKVDRLSRSLLDFARLMEKFEKRGVHFVSVTQHFDTSTSMGRLILNVLLSFAQFEREMIAERTRDKIRATRRRGKWTGGAVPFGYRVVAKRLVPEEKEAAIVRRIFEEYSGEDSTSAISWKLGREMRGERWTKDRVSRIIKNPIYAGLMPTGGEVHPGEHEPIVSRDVFEGANSKIQARRRVFGRKRDPRYVLRSLVRCGDCGYAIVPASTNARGVVHRYYRCGIHDNSGKHRCGGVQLPAAAFEVFVTEELKRVSEEKRFGEVLRLNLEKRAEWLRSEISEIPRAIAEKSGRAGTLAAALSLPELSGAARRGPENEIALIGEELRTLEDRLYAAERELETIDEKSRAEAEWLGSRLEDHSAWTTDDLEERARVFRGLVNEIIVTGGGSRVELCLADWIVRSEAPGGEELGS